MKENYKYWRVKVLSIYLVMILIAGVFIPSINSSMASSDQPPGQGTLSSPAPSSSGTYIFFDDFDNGSLNSNWVVSNSSGNAWVGTHTSNSGSYSMYTRWGVVSVTTIAFDTSSQNIFQVGYWVRRGSSSFSERPDQNEDLEIEYLNSSSTWVLLNRIWGNGTQGQIYTFKKNLTGDACHSGFKLRFRQTGGSSSDCDYFHIDDVFIKSFIRYDHEIVVSNLDIPSICELGKSMPIKAKISNWGKNNETNITVQLKIDDVVKNSTNITSLLIDGYRNITFNWTPQVEKTTKVGICAVPISGENVTINNQLNRTIQIIAYSDIRLDPHGFNLSAMTGELAKDNLTIENKGLSSLDWRIENPSVLFSDDFEDGDYKGWTNISSSYTRQVTSSTAANGTKYSFTQTGSSSHYGGTYTTMAPIQPKYLGFYIRSSSTSTHDAYFVVRDGSSNVIIFLYAQNNGNFHLSGGSSYYSPYSANTWYHVEFKDINWTNDQLDFYIDGKLIQKKATFRNSASDMTRIDLYNYNNAQAWYDEIYIGSKRAMIADWLSAAPMNDTTNPLNKTIVNLTANASVLSPGIYRTNITITSNDPVENELIVPINFTVLSAPHDIRVLDIDVPDHGEAGKYIPINATILNQGTNNETNITIQLKVDGVVVNSTIINTLDSGNLTIITLAWKPMSEKNFFVEIYAIPVTNETGTMNNQLNDTIQITAEADIWVDPASFNLIAMKGKLAKDNLSIGNDDLGILDWKLENPNIIFEDDFEDGDYAGWTNGTGSFTRQVTSTTAAAGSKNSFSLTGGAGEHKKGVYTTFAAAKPGYLSFYLRSSSASKLDTYIRISNSVNDFIWIHAMNNGSFSIYTPSITMHHPYSANNWYHFEINNINWTNHRFDLYINGNLRLASVPFSVNDVSRIDLYNYDDSLAWYDEIFIGQKKSDLADWLTAEPMNGSVSPANNTLVKITANATILEPGYYRSNLTIINNDPIENVLRIPVNFTVLSAPHDIRVFSITVPGSGEAGNYIPINAKILNQGTNNESNITVQLKVDGIVVNSTNISSLQSGKFTIINLAWRPMSEKTFKVEIYAVPVSSENSTENNQLNRSIVITAEANIWLNKFGYNFTAMSGSITNDSLIIGNAGLGKLDWKIETQNTIFSDNFEDGDFKGWNNRSGSYTRQVTSATAANGTKKSFSLIGGSSTLRDGVYTTIKPSQPEYISFYLRSSSTSNHDTFFQIRNNLGTDFLYMYAQNTGRFYIRIGGSTIYYSYSANTWNHFELTNINWTSKRLDLYINDALSRANQAFYSSISNVTQIDLYNYHNSQSWYDEIYLGSQSSELSNWLTMIPMNGSCSPMDQTYVNLIANASKLDPGIYKTNISIFNNDPVDDTIKIPVNFTVLSAPHDIRVLDISVPKTGKAGLYIPVSATIFNQGSNNETNFTIQLKVNNVIVNSTNISSLQSGKFTIVNLAWRPLSAGLFNVEIHVVPVPGENRTDNNQLDDTITITAEPDIWINPVKFDFSVKMGLTETKNFTIKNRGFGDLQFDIINQLLTKSGTSSTTQGDIDDTLAYDVDGDTKFDLFDYINIYAYSSDGDTLSVTIKGFNGLTWTNIYSGSGGSRTVVNGYYLSNKYQKIRIMLDDTENNDNIYYSYQFKIVGTVDWLKINPMSGSISKLNSTQVKITANASALLPGLYRTNFTIIHDDPTKGDIKVPVNLTVNRHAHDIGVTNISLPNEGVVGQNTLVQATIKNEGLNTESNIKIKLKINNVEMNSTTISSLAKGAETIVTLGWIPLNEMIYSITIYSVPVTGEIKLGDNSLNDSLKAKAYAVVMSTPSTFELTALAGTGAQDNLTIRNAGYAQLNWSISSFAKIDETFPSTSINYGIWSSMSGTPTINTRGDNEPSAPYSLNMDGSSDSITSVTFDLSSSPAASMDFYYQLGGSGDVPESNDYLELQYYDSTGSWVQLWLLYGNGMSTSNFNHVYLTIPSGGFHNNFRFKFISSGSGFGQDDFFLDDIFFNFTSSLPSWLDFTSTEGSIGQLSNKVISFWANSTGLKPGLHQTSLCIESNDPIRPTVVFRINFTVRGIFLRVSGTDIAPLYVQQNEKDVSMLNVTVGAINRSVTITAITFNLTGTGHDDTVQKVRLILDLDNNSKFSAADRTLASEKFSLGQITFNGKWNIPKGENRTFIVVFNVSNLAAVDSGIGVRIEPGDIKVATPAIVSAFDRVKSRNAAVLERVDYLTLTPKSLAPVTVIQGQSNVEITLIGLEVKNFGSSMITSIEFDFVGTGLASDISTINLYHDKNNNEQFDIENDVLLRSKSFEGRKVTVDQLSIVVQNGFQKKLIITFDLSPEAEMNSTIGVKIMPEYIKLDEPDELIPFEACICGPITINPNIDLLTPSKPTGLVVESTTFNSTSLRWNTNPESDIMGYNIYRSKLPKPIAWGLPINSPALVYNTKYIDTALNESTTYYYVVTAVSTFPLESVHSEIAFGTTQKPNRKPKINNPVEDFEIPEDTVDDTSINLYDWFSDPFGNELDFWWDFLSEEQAIELNIDKDDGTVILKPQENWSGEVSLIFYATNTYGQMPDDVTITVTPINDPPGPATIMAPTNNSEIEEKQTITFKGSCNDPDLDYGDSLTYTWSSDRSGILGKGSTLLDVFLPPGKHRIILEVTDFSGSFVETSVIINISSESGDGEDGEDGLDNDNINTEKSTGDMGPFFMIMGVIIVLIIIIIILFMMLRKKRTTGQGQNQLPTTTITTPALTQTQVQAQVQPQPQAQLLQQIQVKQQPQLQSQPQQPQAQPLPQIQAQQPQAQLPPPQHPPAQQQTPMQIPALPPATPQMPIYYQSQPLSTAPVIQPQQTQYQYVPQPPPQLPPHTVYVQPPPQQIPQHTVYVQPPPQQIHQIPPSLPYNPQSTPTPNFKDVTEAPEGEVCFTCGHQLYYVKEQDRNYCFHCKKFE